MIKALFTAVLMTLFIIGGLHLYFGFLWYVYNLIFGG